MLNVRRQPPQRRPRGVTLIELLVGLALLALLVTLAAPGLGIWLANSQIRATAEALTAGLHQARSEAVSRNARVRFQLVDTLGAGCALDAAGTNWVVNLDPDNDATAVDRACDSVPSDTVAPRILHTRTAAEGGGATAVAGTAATLVFNGLGRPTPVPAGNITFDITAPAAGACAAAGGVTCLRVVVSPAGQIRMCNPRFTAAANPQGC